MARATVIHSTDGCTIRFNGDPRHPEPSTGAIIFPGGRVEVTRTSDGGYFAHSSVDDHADVESSRIDYSREKWLKNGIPDVPDAQFIEHIAIKVRKGGSKSC